MTVEMKDQSQATHLFTHSLEQDIAMAAPSAHCIILCFASFYYNNFRAPCGVPALKHCKNRKPITIGSALLRLVRLVPIDRSYLMIRATDSPLGKLAGCLTTLHARDGYGKLVPHPVGALSRQSSRMQVLILRFSEVSRTI
jgi:hypothetical protein